MVVCNQLEHQIDRRCAARRCQAIAIDNKDRLGQVDLLKLLGKAVLIFPMDRRLLAVQQPCLGKRIGRCTKTADDQSLTRLPAQPAQHLFARGLLHIHAAADHDRIVAVQFAHIMIKLKQRAG